MMLERMYIILLQLQRRTRGCICSCWLDVLPSVGLGWQAGGGWLSLTYGALSRIMEERGNVGWHTLSLSPPQYMTALPYTHLLTWTCCPPSHGPKHAHHPVCQRPLTWRDKGNGSLKSNITTTSVQLLVRSASIYTWTVIWVYYDATCTVKITTERMLDWVPGTTRECQFR